MRKSDPQAGCVTQPSAEPANGAIDAAILFALAGHDIESFFWALRTVVDNHGLKTVADHLGLLPQDLDRLTSGQDAPDLRGAAVTLRVVAATLGTLGYRFAIVPIADEEQADGAEH